MSIPLYQDHEIFMRRGQYLMHCLKTNRETFNPAYVNSRTCPDCGPLTPVETSFTNPTNIPTPEEPPVKYKETAPTGSNSDFPTTTTIICDKCHLRMTETESGIFYCINGHKKILMNLVESSTQSEKPQKRRRSLQIHCPQCGKVAQVTQESKVFGKIARKYSCGHTEYVDLLAPPLDRDETWNKLYKFQQEGVEFIENANYAGLIGDEMGLGKTVQALAVLRYNYEELTPCLIVCEAAKVYDWRSEFETWVGDKFNKLPDMPVIHTKGTFGICPGFKNHIISMSLLQKPDVFDSILEYGFKLIIVDESHSFKNEKAERTYSLQKIVETIPHKIFLSGTPIMNKVTEYFTVLNLLRPSHFPSKDSLVSKCDRAPNGRVLGISNHWRPRFFHQISEYVIRRTKKDAGIKLPNFRSLKRYVSIENNRKFVKEYNDLIDELDKTISAKRGDAGTSRHLLGLFAQFRHVVGLAKVEPVLQMVEEFMESTDPTDKITIGYYHKLVGDYLEKGLREYNPLRISDEPGLTKMNRIEEFKKPERRLLLASIKGAGQGLNIQFCKNAVVAEREWNPAREEQFINRFHRIEKNPDGTIKTEFDDAKDSVTVEFLNVAKTIDEFFDALVELKTHVVSATLEEEFAYDYDFLMDLAEKIVASRLYVSG